MSSLFGCLRNIPDKESSESCEKVRAIHAWGDLIANTDLTDIQKRAIKVRVLSVVKRLRDRLFWLSIGYTILRTTTTVGSLLVPSLLAVQSNIDANGAYWSMWGIGLSVSLSNAFVSLFRVDKNYFTVGGLIEKIESEAWMYLTLSGKYHRDEVEDSEEGITGHRALFSRFMERCEIMMNKAISTEYIPGQVPSGNKSITNDHHSLMGKRFPRAPPRSNDPYEIVDNQVDDKHNRGANNSGNLATNVREYRSGSDSTIESGGVPVSGRGRSGEQREERGQSGVVSTPQGFEGV